MVITAFPIKKGLIISCTIKVIELIMRSKMGPTNAKKLEDTERPTNIERPAGVKSQQAEKNQ